MPPRRHEQRNAQQATEVFVNPYTFVPFFEPGNDFRRAPAGHHALNDDCYLGEVTVALTAKAPLLLRGITQENAESFPRRGDLPFIPASSLAGVVRSLHELIAGGCLRVFDDEFTPGYRDLASSRGKDWRLVRVAEVDASGRPTTLSVCEEAVWVPARLLAQVLGGPDNVVSGARVDVINVTAADRVSFGQNNNQQVTRLEATRGPRDQNPQIVPGGGSVVLVTDAGARKNYKSFYCATGKLTDKTAALTDDAWSNFLISIADTDDMRIARGAQQLRPDAPVKKLVKYVYGEKGPEPVGYRHEARPRLFPGQVLWAKVDNTQSVVNELALAAIWRHPGKYPARKRVPEALLPCRDPDELCPTCRIFGSADTMGGDKEARQRSYRGHVCFSDALPEGEVTTRPFRLPPLGSPRPGAGQFYLTTPVSGAASGTPLREWGSPAADKEDRPRRLNGRKQYWLTRRAQDRPFFRVDGEFRGTMASDGEAVESGAAFTFTVRFDGLTTAEIGGLLAALSPRLALPGRGALGIAVGGGRPLGFGTCSTEVVELSVESAGSRYLADAPPALEPADAVAAFREAAPPEVRDTWPLVAKALRMDQVDPADVWYPPKAGIPADRLSPADLEPGFEFWNQSRGLKHLTRGPDRLRQLPKLEEKDQELPVRTPKDRGKPW